MDEERVVRKAIEEFEFILKDCVEHHDYPDDAIAPINGITIGDVKVLLEVLKSCVANDAKALCLERVIDELDEKVNEYDRVLKEIATLANSVTI